MTTTQVSFEQLKLKLGHYFTAEEQDYVFPLLLAWAGCSDQAIFWFNNELIPAFGNISALSFCENGHTKAFIEYIKSAQLGGYA
ncbi:hypothetical protein K8B83_07010 [Shewanella inventionis]|uniref:hypothetical protein n=1 Tax=Shewanella inventionis TaxID=1738770 RepID=UPI001CBFBFF7|nr:hypothetical protein [Shewanella inventionis]UAL44571.1 hypothetical protein K8B83_07010 [Shewanella inventionis]|tara:strand:- start:19249 stop:19500 length:252 start_codon:yes stop_codon:yes gene_type:complete